MQPALQKIIKPHGLFLMHPASQLTRQQMPTYRKLQPGTLAALRLLPAWLNARKSAQSLANQ